MNLKFIINKATTFSLLAAIASLGGCGNNNPTQGHQAVVKSIKNQEQGNYLVATQYGETKVERYGDGKLLGIAIGKNNWIVNEFDKDGNVLQQVTQNPINDKQLRQSLRVFSYDKILGATGVGLWSVWANMLGVGSVLTANIEMGNVVFITSTLAGIVIGLATQSVILKEHRSFEGEDTTYNTWLADPIREFEVRMQRAETIADTQKDLDFTQRKYDLIVSRLKEAGKDKTK